MNTYSITLNLPESLYQHLSRRSQQLQRSLEEELVTLLSMKMPIGEGGTPQPSAYNEVIEFLGRGPSATEISEFHLSSAAQTRAQSLLQKNKEGPLSPAEEAELESYIELEDFMALIKIRALQQLQNKS